MFGYIGAIADRDNPTEIGHFVKEVKSPAGDIVWPSACFHITASHNWKKTGFADVNASGVNPPGGVVTHGQYHLYVMDVSGIPETTQNFKGRYYTLVEDDGLKYPVIFSGGIGTHKTFFAWDYKSWNKSSSVPYGQIFFGFVRSTQSGGTSLTNLTPGTSTSIFLETGPQANKSSWGIDSESPTGLPGVHKKSTVFPIAGNGTQWDQFVVPCLFSYVDMGEYVGSTGGGALIITNFYGTGE